MILLTRPAATLLTPLFILALAVSLSACKPEAEKQAAETPVVQTTPEVAANTTSPDMPGPVIAVPPEIQTFLTTLQSAIQADNRAAVAAMVRYPLTTYDKGEPTGTYKDAAALLAAYDTLFTQGVQNAIRSATPDTLFTNADGVMIGNGEIWIDDTTTPPMIKSINAQVPE